MTLNLINQNTTIKSSKKSKCKLAAWSTTVFRTPGAAGAQGGGSSAQGDCMKR